MEYQLV